MASCTTCGETVYNAERVHLFERDYHQHCFKCVDCGTRLTKGNHLEHDKDLYCKNCHSKKFGTIVVEDNKLGAAKVNHNKREKEERKELEVEGMNDELFDEEELKLLQSILNPEVEKKAVDNLGRGNRCISCSENVGHAEEIRKAGKVYHKNCYTCTNCKSRLNQGAELESKGKLYCSNCHRKLFATKTYGFGTYDDNLAEVKPQEEI